MGFSGVIALLIGVINPNYHWWGPALHTSQNLCVVPLKNRFFCWASPPKKAPKKASFAKMVHAGLLPPHLPCGTSLDLCGG